MMTNTHTTEPLRILRLIARLNIGGPAIQAIRLTAALNDEHFKSLLVTGVVGQNEGDMRYLADQLGVEPVVIPTLGREIHWYDDVLTLIKLIRIMRQFKPDLIHTHTAKAGTLGRLAALVAGNSKKVHTFHGHVFSGYFSPWKTRLFILIERFLAKRTDRIIAISARQKHDLCNVYAIAPDEKVTVVPLGLDLQPFAEVAAQDHASRNLFGLQPQHLVVTIAGRLVPIKNHKMFLQVAQKVACEMEHARFLIVGEGELRVKLEAYAQELGISDKVLFAGWHKEMRPVYAASDIVVLTSLNEGTPVSLIEAMASARAVVTTEVGGVADFVEDGVDGFYVPSGNVDAMVSRVLLLARDASMRLKMGAHGREQVLRLFDFGRLRRDVEDLYVHVSGQ